jgi:hypothetical protein
LGAWQGLDIGSIFGKIGAVPDKASQQERERVKSKLLNLCSQSKVERSDIETVIADLQPLSPTPASAASSLLQKEWVLLWTTEKEINFFIDFGIASEATQTIAGTSLGNLIAFRRGGGLSVQGNLSVPDVKGVRTNFQFDTATLDLGRWGNYQFPPVGQGWFDTVYLDETLRVDTNSRDDILICTPRR